ncbi:MAG: hypothetical protein ACTSXT_03515 [Candidatus Helarchaeota archaeon]
MKEDKQFLLNIVAIISFILYAIGIYLHVAILGEKWGNVAVDFAIEIVGALWGVIFVVLIGALILLLSFYVNLFKKLNIFLCFFWIFSLYQCAINSFLQFFGLPDEPINQFFKYYWPNLWYPVKEIFFTIISIILTIIWVKKVSKTGFKKTDALLIAILIIILIGGTLYSQLFLIH